jgi:hypothetical protein
MRGLSVRFTLTFLAVISSGFFHLSTAQTSNPKLEEIIAKHLAAIGAEETRRSVSTRLITGIVIAAFRSPQLGRIAGNAALASEGEKNIIGMSFDRAEYPIDKFGYDGSEVTTSYIRPGVRSTLADFLKTHETIIEQGLLGGTLSTAWPLFDENKRGAKLEYGGIKRIGEREAYEIRYSPRKGADLKIRIYLDRTTFQHIRTLYERTIPPPMGIAPDLSASQRETRYRMIEDFSDFRKEGGLMLPHTYKLQLELETRNGTYLAEWEMRLSNFAFNPKLHPRIFKAN